MDAFTNDGLSQEEKEEQLQMHEEKTNQTHGQLASRDGEAERTGHEETGGGCTETDPERTGHWETGGEGGTETDPERPGHEASSVISTGVQVVTVAL